MHHLNIFDLAVFPCILKWPYLLSHHKGGLHVLKEDTIWDTEKEVWNKLLNCKIARSYVLSYRIAKKVISNKGDNAFLGEKRHFIKRKTRF